MRRIALSKKIKLIRSGMGWSQAELAAYLKKTPGTISRYETGMAIPPGDVLDKIYALKDRVRDLTFEF